MILILSVSLLDYAILTTFSLIDMTTKVIALTGGIGSGKSRILQWFAEQGVPTLSADEIAREVVAPGTPGLQAIVDQLGTDILLEDGQLNRGKLRKRMFAEPALKTWLEQLLHPMIRQQTLKHLQTLRQKNPPLIVIEIPLLAETGKPDYIDQVWIADCQETTQCQRAAQRDGKSEMEIQSIIQQQASRQQRLALADRVINTELPFEEVEKHLKKALKAFLPQ
ncbi:dephospho-CoA kinase [Galenea microaerophila]